MITVGSKLTLKGKTLKGKNKIARYGNLWRVTQITPGGNFGDLLIEAIIPHIDGTRWIHSKDDPNFNIVEVE